MLDDTVTMTPGLTDDEFARIEGEFSFEFADDHRAFLSTGLPVGESWPDWRSGAHRGLKTRLRLPAAGILFAVEWRGFWCGDWGERPARMKDALRSAHYHLARVPQLVPVHSNHYLPAGRDTSGNPVLSVYKTDVTLCATDISAYLGRDLEPDQSPQASIVPFWSDLIVDA